MEWHRLIAAVVISASVVLPVVGAPQVSAAPSKTERQPLPARSTTATTATVPSLSGVPAYSPAASQVESEVIDAARLLGIPLVRTPRFPTGRPAAFFAASALSDRQFPTRLRAYVQGGGRALVTSRLASRLGRLPSEHAGRIYILPSSAGSTGVLSLPQAQVDRLRNFVLYPLGLRMEAPPRVSLRLIGSDTLVLENHNAFAAGVKLTFFGKKWPAVEALAGDEGILRLMGSSISLQAPPQAVQRFQVVSRL